MTDHDSRLDRIQVEINSWVLAKKKPHTALKEIARILDEESPKQEDWIKDGKVSPNAPHPKQECKCGGLTSGAKTVKEHTIALENCPIHGCICHVESRTIDCPRHGKSKCSCGEPHVSDRITHRYDGKPCYVTDSKPAEKEQPTKECCVCGSKKISYENYKGQLFCWPCADGKPKLKPSERIREASDERQKIDSGTPLAVVMRADIDAILDFLDEQEK